MTDRQCIKKQRHRFAGRGPYSQSYRFSSNHVWKWELDQKKVECQKTDAFKLMLEKNLESPLDSKEIKPVNSEGNLPRILNERTDVETEAPILWTPDEKNWLTGKDPDARKS